MCSDLIQPSGKCHRVYQFFWWLLALELFCLFGECPCVLCLELLFALLLTRISTDAYFARVLLMTGEAVQNIRYWFLDIVLGCCSSVLRKEHCRLLAYCDLHRQPILICADIGTQSVPAS
jgi:hypothetical protein